MPIRPRRTVPLALAALLLAGCTADPAPSGSTPRQDLLIPAFSTATAGTDVIATDDPARTAIRVSTAFYASSPLVVLSAATEADLATGASLAVAAGVPLLVDGGRVDAELDRLGVTHAITVGDVRELLEVAVAPVESGDSLAGLVAAGLDLADAEPVAADGLLAAVSELGRPSTPVLTLAAADPEPAGTSDPEPAGTSDPEPASTEAPVIAPTWSMPGAAQSDSPWPDDKVAYPDATFPEGSAVLVDPTADDDPLALIPALATARAAGVPVVPVPGGDPRGSTDTVDALTGTTSALGLGDSFGGPDTLTPRLAAAATGEQLPGGGQLIFPEDDGLTGKRYIALYGTPGTPALGVLGEQDVAATIARAEETARGYRALTDDAIVPTLEIIATIASSAPEADGSYSRPRAIDDLRPLIEAAADADMAVVLDLQPGRTDFLTQAQQYADLLEYPNVGLALDPEWRLKPDQVHLRQIGSVSVDEVNQVSDWLARFVRERQLPQKMFLLHQFSLRMITDRERLNVDHDELATIIHADGQGTQPAKTDTWNALRQGAPAVHWGWKNFYDEDQPMLTPEQTYQVSPVPDLVTYQ